MFFAKEEDVQMLHEAGFHAAWVGDIAEGDRIMIDHSISGVMLDRPTEMVVTRLERQERADEGPLLRWIGVLPSGAGVHCAYHRRYECWKHQGEAQS